MEFHGTEPVDTGGPRPDSTERMEAPRKVGLVAKQNWLGRFEIPAAAAIGLVGVALRLHRYLQFGSMWNDETNVAVNLTRRTVLGLLRPLDYGEVAPVGFLILEKAVMSVLGNTDYVLRLVPLLASLLSLPVAYVVARRLLTGAAPLLTVLLLALSPIQIYFASTLKQFSFDVLATLVLCLLGANVLHRGATRKSMGWLVLSGVVLTWFSHPSVFVIGGVLVAAGWSFAAQKNKRGLLALSAVAAIQFGMGLIQYFAVLHHSDANRVLEAYWGWAFLPIFSSSTLPWLLSVLVSIFRDVLQLPWNMITASLAAVGVLALAIRRWHVLVLLMTPIALALIASSLKLYPFTGRFLLFAAPLLFMIIAEGVATLWMAVLRWDRRAATVIVMACVIYIAYPLVARDLSVLQAPSLRDHIKPVLAHMQTHSQQGDVVYVYYMAESQWAYYAPFYDLDDLETIVGTNSRDRPHRYHLDIEALEGRSRVWFVFSHNYTAGRVDEQAYFLSRLDRIGVRMDEAAAPWAAAYLYDLSGVP